nr:tectonic-1-like [Nerophis lumbriciformis]
MYTFLVDRTSLCSRRVDLKDDCSFLPALSIDTYTNIKLYAIIPVMTASVMLQSLEGTLSKVRVSEAANLRPHFINQNVCTNVVLKVSYLVKYNTTGQIVNAEVELLLGNFHLTPLSLQQEYGIKFIQDSIDNIPVRKSGNPGYAVGLPILSGQAIAEYPFSGMLLNSNPGDRLSLLQSSANHNCMNSPHQRSPVLFGVESILEDTTNCSLVSQIILDVLQGQTYPQYVAKFGNSALENSLEWLTIKHANNNKGTQICSIPLSLDLKIKWTKYGLLWNPQIQIVSIEQVILTNTTSLANFIRGSDAISIRSSVSFREISAAALPGYRAIPTINAKLPVDFFFPFV